MKRIVALLLGIMILFSGINVYGAEETLEKKAQRLDKLSILKGDGRSYNLAGTLTRQEAATFIVRLQGAEKEVLSNKATYSKVPFKDVKVTDWSAPYIGYCVQKGIINGYEDKTFRPTAKLDLQAFAKLLLVSLGYVNDKDFVWTTTLDKAKTVKLVTQEEINLAKNNPFTRGDVIRLLDRILPMKNVQSEKEMYYNLLKADGITEQTLAEVGFVRKVGENKIEAIRELSPGRFTIRFSTPPKAFSADNMVLVEEGGRNLKVKSIKATDLLNVFTVDTDAPSENTKYQIVVRNVIDRAGNLFQEYREEMISLRKGALESDLFRISQAKVLDTKTLEIEFTHPIEETMENSNYYSIKVDNRLFALGNEVTVHLAGGNKVKLRLKNQSFAENQIYTLFIKGEARSKLGVRLNSGNEDKLSFKGNQIKQDKLDVMAIELLDANTIRLSVNKKVRVSTAEQVFSYYLTDSNKREMKINKASLLQADENEYQSIILKMNDRLYEGRNYNLRINQLYTEDRSEEIIDKDYPFTAGIVSNGTYDLSYATQVDPYTIEVGFDTDMDNRSATNKDNYYIRKETGSKMVVPASVYHDYENNRFYLYLSESLTENNTANYFLYAKTDIRGAKGEQRRDQARVSFGISNPEVVKVGFDKVNYLGDNSIQVRFTEPVAKAVPNLDVYNFHIYEKETGQSLSIAGVVYVDGHRLVLNTRTFDTKKVYVLKVKEILEYNGSLMVRDLPEVEIESGNVVQ